MAPRRPLGGRCFPTSPCDVDSPRKEPALPPKLDDDTLEAYLQRLPDGAASYPDYRAKGSVLRALTDGHDLHTIAQRLPAPARSMLDSRPTVTSWLPEVHLNLAILATRELFFESDDAFLEDAYRRNRALLEGPLYRTLSKFLSKDRIGAMGSLVFGQVHQGIEVEYQAGEPARWALHSPAHLIPPLVGRCYVTVLEVALELGGEDVRTNIVQQDAETVMAEIVVVRPPADAPDTVENE